MAQAALRIACYAIALCASVLLAAQQPDSSAIRRYSREAQQALAEKDTVRAAAALEALERLTPNNPAVEANLGTVYYMQSRYQQAAASFRRALRLDPHISSVRPLLGICYAELGRSHQAIPILVSAFQHPPSEAVGRLVGIDLMRAYRSAGDGFNALEVSEELLKRYPDDPEILYRTGHLYGDRALEIMQRLVKVAPNSPWKRMAFAEVLEGEKRYDLAIIEYRKVIAADPRMPDVHYRLGRALLLSSKDNKEEQDAALSELHEALKMDPRNAPAAYEIGQVYRRRGQVEEAEAYFSRAVTVDPHREDAQIALAQALLALHQPAEALPHLRMAVQLDLGNGAAHFLLAGVYRSEGDASGYAREMALYRKYRAHPVPDSPSDVH